MSAPTTPARRFKPYPSRTVTPEGVALDQIRTWLKQGATIRATDPEGEILALRPDGTMHGGLTITGLQGK